MKKNNHPLLPTTNEYDRELSLVMDLKAWIEDEEFEPPFPFNVLWDNSKKTRNLRLLAEAAQRAYDNAIEKELKMM